MNPSALPPQATHRKNHTIDRLLQWAEFLEIAPFSFFNLIETPGDVRSKDVDTERARELVEGYDVVLALGGFVSGCLDRLGVEHFKLPHPSPRNRLLNSKEFEQETLRECKQYVQDGPHNRV